MDPVNPWLDPSEVRHLAEQLLRPVAPARLSAADPGFDSSFVGFMTSDAQPAAPPQPEAPAPAPLVGKIVGPTAAPAQSPEPPPAAPSRTRFLERIQIFRDWLAKHFRATDIFILDREGKVIFDESGHGRLHFMARNLALASRGSGNIHVKIGPASILEVVPCETPYGRIVLGAIVPESLPANHVQTITEVLIQTASPA
ncbi:hypothetical protein HZ994_17010 [Akkermansiaceae bacterium]|nr:hypothetical protein HZ994_17010 [Akkermansiaceae bacterium]